MGTYLQTLQPSPGGQRFVGSVGLYFRGGHIAFFRRRLVAKEANEIQGGDIPASPWETTGFVTDISWAQGCQLTPCVAFGSSGEYHVQMVSLRSSPPFEPETNRKAYDTGSWTRL